jgi:hypothetical protein
MEVSPETLANFQPIPRSYVPEARNLQALQTSVF